MKEPYYKFDELYPFGGHGSKSVYLAQRYIPLTWEEAVRHTTLIPAQVFGLARKGRMNVGMDADIVVFEPDHLTDTAKFPGLGKPDAAPEGIRYVIVAGEVAAHNGQPTGVMAGRALAAGMD